MSILCDKIFFGGDVKLTNALIFSIEEFSVFDGPGIRTSVFLMGCPLRCEWCHNPEGQGFSNFIMRSQNGCIGCGECIKHAVLKNGKHEFTEESIKNCPRGLLRYCAEEMSSAELCQRLEKNLDVLNSTGGGVTFSGGEPTANPDFLLECLSLLKGKTNRAVQTCGYCAPNLFDKILQNCDYMLFDVKLADNALHKKYTGVSNENILKNLQALAHGNIDFVIRTPLIPTVTDTEDNIRAIAELLSLNGVGYIELLPYNKMAGAKYGLASKTYSPSFDGTLPVNPRAHIFEQYGIEVKII